MDFQQKQQQQLVGTKKRRHMPQELFGRFSSKADFIRYFKETSKQTQSLIIKPVQCNYTCRLST